MPKHVPTQPDSETLLVLAKLGGIQDDPEHLAVLWPAVQTFHAAAARLRELDLSNTEPALVYHVTGGQE
ncbi:MAG: hypothetical protein ACYC4L_13000 [Chloroflexota bacterium]